MRHPDVPAQLRGTYAGLAHPAFVEHLRSLGVTAVELLPVHHFVSEPHLLRRGLTNYWGYNTLGFFAPHAALQRLGQRRRAGHRVQDDGQGAARRRHRGDPRRRLQPHRRGRPRPGPTLSFRGIDNAGYYRLDRQNPARYTDYTGCGNTLDVRRSAVLGLLMDSLRYWVTEMHVDGFRFDLASALARSMHDVDRLSAFFDVVHQDPVVSRVKLIAEPWDVGPGGYQVGNFPPPWTEWNGKYRDTVRDVWSGAHVGVRDLAYRLTGSSDLYRSDGRRPFASINFVTAHDGFTLRDLVTYEHKRNEANGEDNRDGESHNRNWNCGVEGATDDPEVTRAPRPAGAQPAGHPAAVDRGADAHRRRRARPHPARQQQRLLPGQRAVLAGLDAGRPGPARVRRPRAGAAPLGAGAAAGGVLRGPRAARHRRHPRPRVVRPRRRAADHRGLVRHRPADGRHVPRRARHPAPRRPGPAGGRRLLPDLAARRAGAAHRAAARRALGRRLRAGRLHRVRHRRTPGDGDRRPGPGRDPRPLRLGAQGRSAGPDGVPSQRTGGHAARAWTSTT